MADDQRWRDNLRKAREAMGLTLDQLARLSGKTKSQISMLEKGKRPFTQKTLSVLVDELGIDFADLFCGCSLKKRKTDPADFDPKKIRSHHNKIVNISSAR